MELMQTLLTPAEVSEWTGLTIGALAQLRYKGTGPKFVKMTPRTVRYFRADVQRWLEDSVRSSTAEVAR